MTAYEVFDRIYRDNLWNGVESRSGPGSGPAATRAVSAAIVDLVRELGAETVLDVGCGDGYWMPDLPGYVGMDVSREALRIARRFHPERRYTTRMPGRRFDLVITRDAMQHLPLEYGLGLLGSIVATRSEWLLASTYIGGENVDIRTGDAYSPDLTAAPFSLGQPARLLFDGEHYHTHGTKEVRDARKHLGLWRIAS